MPNFKSRTKRLFLKTASGVLALCFFSNQLSFAVPASEEFLTFINPSQDKGLSANSLNQKEVIAQSHIDYQNALLGLGQKSFTTAAPENRINYTYHPDGTVKSSDEYIYENGLLSSRKYKAFNTSGILTSELLYTYVNGKLTQVDNYNGLNQKTQSSIYDPAINKVTRVNAYNPATGNITSYKVYVYSGTTLVRTESYTAPKGSIAINSNSSYSNSRNVTLSLAAVSEPTSGMSQMRFSLDAGVTWTAWESFNANKSIQIGPGEGAHQVQAQVSAVSGLVTTFSDSIILDTVAPGGSISINGNADYTNSRTVTLALTGTDATSGLGLTRFSIDGGATWGAWGKFTAAKTLLLNNIQGTHNIQYQVKDLSGLISTFSDSIILDSAVPTGSILINGNAAYANSRNVTLTITGTDTTSGIRQMRFSTDNGVTWTAWENFAATKSIQLGGSEGTSQVQYQIQDFSGLVSTFSDKIILDMTAPVGTISINSNAEYTKSGNVTLTLTGADTASGLGQMRFSTDNGVTWGAWTKFATVKSFQLGTVQGLRQIQCQIQDLSGLVSTVFSDSIVLDTAAPTGSVSINNNAASTNSRNVTLTLAGADTVSGLGQMRFSVDNGVVWTAWENFAATKAIQLSATQGTSKVQYQIQDRSGLVSTFSDTIFLDSIAPSLGLLSDAYVYSPVYQLRYRVSDANMTTVTKTENVTLSRGVNSFTRQAQDSYGNTRQMTWNVVLDQNADRGLSYDYDAVGNIVRQTNFNGADINFTYDANNRPVTITYPEYPSVQIHYNNIGEVERVTDLRGNTDYGHDIAGRISSITLPNGQRLDYVYDLAGRVIQSRYAGKVINYTYDTAGRLTSVADGVNVTTYGYNAAGDLISTTLPNGMRTKYTYDTSARLTKVRHEKTDNSALVAEFVYTLDASGQRTKMVENRPSGVRTVDYVYDGFKRLIQESDSLHGVIKYTYDNAGNRLSKETIPLVIAAQTPRVVTQYTYGIDNRLTSLTDKTYDSLGAQLSSRTESFVYDAAGNLRQRITPDKVYYYEFDSRNLLVRFNDGQNETVYDYDGAGNRVAKTVNGVKTSYLFDPTSPLPQVLAEFDASGNAVKTYAFGADRLSSTVGGVAQYYMQDGLGSSIGLANSEGVVSEAYSYDAFGNPHFQSSSQNFLYTGEQRDAETGFVYLRARYYDPALGRFISRDPAFVGKQAETQSLNPFIYVQNNPVNYIDPLGLMSVEQKGIVAAASVFLGTKLAVLAYLAAGTPPGLAIMGTIAAAGVAYANSPFVRSAVNGIAQAGIEAIATYSGESFRETASSTTVGMADNLLSGLFGVDAPGAPGPIATILNNLPSNSPAQDSTSGSFPSENQSSFPGTPGSLLSRDDNYRLGIMPPPNGPFDGGFDNWNLDTGFGNSNHGLIGALQGSPFDLGGVYMDKALSIIGQNIQDIHGVTYDPLTGQIIMLSNTGTNVPQIPVDYFIAALKSIYGHQAIPGVSIDIVKDANGNNDLTKDQKVRFLGGIENTALGQAVYEADLLMKLIGIGVDNVTKTHIRPNGQNISESYISQHIPGFKDYFTISSEVADPSILTQPRNIRSWFVPKQMNLVKSEQGDAFVFDDNSVQLLTETSFMGNGSSGTISDDPIASVFVKFFNDNFTELAALYPEFAELEKGMRAVGLAKFIYDNNIPVDLNWLSKAALPSVVTPTTTPLASSTKTVKVKNTNQQVMIALSGGVEYGLFNGKNFQYLSDSASRASGLRDASQAARANDTTQSWSVAMNGTTYKASAFSFAPTKKDGNFSWGGTDLSYSTSGEASLTWQRYYDSFAAGDKSAMGSGWDYMPYGLRFPIAKTTQQFDLDGTSNNKTIYPSIYLSDKAGGRSVLFKPMGLQANGRIFYSSENLKVGSEVLFLNTDGSYALVRDGNEVSFNGEGLLASISDKNSNTIEYVYDETKRLIRIDDKSSARSIAVAYDANSRISKVTGADGRSVSYVYDNAKNNLTKVTQSWSGRFINMTYDNEHRLLSAVDNAGRRLFTNTYDLLGRLTTQTNYLGAQTNSNSNLIAQQTDYVNTANGAQSGFSYDSLFRVTSAKDALGNESQYQYAANSLNVQSITDATGNIQNFEYDVYGNIRSITDALGNKTNYYYKTNNLGESRLLFMEKANGYGTFYEYDEAGNLTSMIEGSRIQSIVGNEIKVLESNFKTVFVYDSKGRLIQVRDANNNITDYAYDDVGNVIKISKAQSQDVQNIKYVIRGGVTTSLVSKATDALGRAITYGYTARDFVTSVATAAGVKRYTYDSRDRLTQLTDEFGRKTQYLYDTKDQLTGTLELGDLTTAADDIVANFTLNNLGQLTGILGPLGAVTQFAYDLGGRMAKLFISENSKNYSSGGKVAVGDLKEDAANLIFTVGTDVKQVKIFYKKKTDVLYQSFTVSNPIAGDNQVTLQNLLPNTDYDFEIQYTDLQNDISYSRKYVFKTTMPELPVILNAAVQTITDTTASIKIDVSKEIASSQITYHVRGESVNRKIYTESVRDAKTNGLVFNLESLRSGQDYDVSITITDRFGNISLAKTVSFKTSGVPSPVDSAEQSTSRYGKIIVVLTTQALISIENNKLIDPLSENYNFEVWDSLGRSMASVTGSPYSSPLLGKGIVLNGLTANSSYTYKLIVTSRSDIAPVSGAFQTAAGGDTTVSTYSLKQITSKDPTSMVLGFTFVEKLKMFQISLIDKITQAVKDYFFFDVVASNIVKLFLLDGLNPGKTYAIKLLATDMAGNISTTSLSLNVATPTLDEVPPTITSTLTSRTATAATIRVVTNELLKRLRVRYRPVGSSQWTELTVTSGSLAFNVTLSDLLPEIAYEYQYSVVDRSENQTLTEWVLV